MQKFLQKLRGADVAHETITTTVANQEELVEYYSDKIAEIPIDDSQAIFETCDDEADSNGKSYTAEELLSDNSADTQLDESISQEEQILDTVDKNTDNQENSDHQDKQETPSDTLLDTSDAPQTDLSDLNAQIPDGLTLRQYADDTNKSLVALIDTGTSYATQSVNFTDEADEEIGTHGNEVASTILDENSDNVILLGIKALSSEGKGTMSDVMEGIQYAINTDVDIINMSFVASADNETEEFDKLVQDAIDKGIMIVAAAGNQNTNASNYIPAKLPNVLTVGARNEDGVKLRSSNYGDCVDYYMIADSTSIAAAKLTKKLTWHADLSSEITNATIKIVSDEEAPEHTDGFQAQTDIWDWIYLDESGGTLFMHASNGDKVGNLSGSWTRAGRSFNTAHTGLGVTSSSDWTYRGNYAVVFNFVPHPVIKFDANGGSGGTSTLTIPCSNVDWSFNASTNGQNFGYYHGNYSGEGGKWISTYKNAGSKTGYSFAGWDLGGLNSNKRISTNYTFKAKWNVNYYMLSGTGDGGIESIEGTGSYAYGTTAKVTYHVKPGYHITMVTEGSNSWTTLAGKEGAQNDTWYMSGNRSFNVYTAPNANTMVIDPNGGSYNGTTNKTAFTGKMDEQREIGATPTKEDQTFAGWTKSGGGALHSGNSESRFSYVSQTEKSDSSGVYTNYSLSYANTSKSISYPSITFFHYNYTLGHKYRLSYDIRINKMNGFDYSHVRHSAFSNNWGGDAGLVALGINSITDGNWVHQEIDRTFNSSTLSQGGSNYTVDPCIEFYCAILPGNTGTFDFDIKNITVYDVTSGTYPTSKSSVVKNGSTLSVGNSSSTVTAVWNKLPIYENSTLDNLLNTTYFGELSGDMQNSIVAHDITQNGYQYWRNAMPLNGSGTAITGTYTEGGVNKTISFSTSDWSKTINRKVYAIGLSDVLDYTGGLTNNSVKGLFGNNVYTALRDSITNFANAIMYACNNESEGRGDHTVYSYSGNVINNYETRPTYEIKLNTKN